MWKWLVTYFKSGDLRQSRTHFAFLSTWISIGSWILEPIINKNTEDRHDAIYSTESSSVTLPPTCTTQICKTNMVIQVKIIIWISNHKPESLSRAFNRENAADHMTAIRIRNLLCFLNWSSMFIVSVGKSLTEEILKRSAGQNLNCDCTMFMRGHPLESRFRPTLSRKM